MNEVSFHLFYCIISTSNKYPLLFSISFVHSKTINCHFQAPVKISHSNYLFFNLNVFFLPSDFLYNPRLTKKKQSNFLCTFIFQIRFLARFFLNFFSKKNYLFLNKCNLIILTQICNIFPFF